MKKLQTFSIKAPRQISLILLPIFCISIPITTFSLLSQVGMATELQRESELSNTLPGTNSEANILDATNPLDLMNRLRRATAMDDATSPSDAIDQALRALETDSEKGLAY